jgi:hypothetical protein
LIFNSPVSRSVRNKFIFFIDDPPVVSLIAAQNKDTL